jgi:hypothetical protein
VASKLLSGIETAINTEKYGDLAQYFHEDLRITTITQEVMFSRADIEPYFEFWFGEGGYLKKLDMKLEADALTEFYADKTIGVVRGSGDEDYVLSDTRFFPMKTRWTATVIKDTDGKWRILTLHIGTGRLLAVETQAGCLAAETHMVIHLGYFRCTPCAEYR